MKKNIKIFFIIIIFFIISFLIWGINIYNNLIILDEDVKYQWGKVDNAYQRRADLIPNLVNTVKGASNFEKETLLDVIKARNNLTSININSKNLKQEEIDKFQNIQNKVNNTLNRLLITVEKYPEIKSINNFSELQSQIEGTENRINVERNHFNESVQLYNQYRNRFPNFLIANFFNIFYKKGYFKSEKYAVNVPHIDFNK